MKPKYSVMARLKVYFRSQRTEKVVVDKTAKVEKCIEMLVYVYYYKLQGMYASVFGVDLGEK